MRQVSFSPCTKQEAGPEIWHACVQEQLKQQRIAEREAKDKQRAAEREAKDKERMKKAKEDEKRRAKEEAARKEEQERLRKVCSVAVFMSWRRRLYSAAALPAGLARLAVHFHEM